MQTTEQIIQLLAHSGLNDIEKLTIHEAIQMNKEGKRISFPGNMNKAKEHIPNLIKRKFIHMDTLKYTGMILLTKEGIKFYEQITADQKLF